VEHFDRNWRALQLENLVELSLWVGRLRTPGELIEELLHRAVGLLDARQGRVVLFNTETDGEEEYVTAGALPSLPSFEEIFSSRPEDILTEGYFIGTAEVNGRSADILAAPLLRQGRMLGYICLADKESRQGRQAFSDSDARYLSALAGVVSNAVENSRHLMTIEKEKQRLEEENHALKLLGQSEGFIASSPVMLKLMELLVRIAPTDVSVMFRGESGSGKERLARLLHSSSSRSKGPFVALNCAALPESLLEAELFGIEEGVATGVRGRRGKLESAHGGTLFLDEIGDLSLPLQAKILRVVQEREFERLGGRKSLSFDARLVTATNRDLEMMISDGLFREDLYYRLRVVVVTLPPLRERRTDIPLLARFFLKKYSSEFSRTDLRISREALRALNEYSFPGNVRELENRIQAAVAMALDHGTIESEDLGLGQPSLERPDDQRLQTLEELERDHVLRVLQFTGGRKTDAARILGIDRSTLYRKMGQIATKDAECDTE